eukprot:Nitzschia sp. Nitz4//scaffold198_size39746//34150//35145//NITZ4_007607-RA/size39746-processed-gene-0.38-mRNA-1//1//CDS//3329540536//8383//frame0
MMNYFTANNNGDRSAKVLATSDMDRRLIGDEPTWRHWMFGDFHADSHRFLEHALFRAPKEVGCAAAASLMVSPIVSIIDKCMVQDISGTLQFFKAIAGASQEMVFSPRKFFGGLSFRLTVVVYFGTYAVANLSELALDLRRIQKDQDRKNIKVAASSVANISLLGWRDSVFAREFSANTPKHATPMRTLGLFAARDGGTMYATFYVAPALADHLQDEYEWERTPAELGCALGVPVIAQFLTAPFHIHAMDYYAKPEATLKQRWSTIVSEFTTVAFARGFRILPAFGIGSFSNNRLREYMIRHDYDPELPANSLQRRITTSLGLKDPKAVPR